MDQGGAPRLACRPSADFALTAHPGCDPIPVCQRFAAVNGIAFLVQP